ncbi:hypothetical protein K1719_009531 [Acacia pycnantha]|nr:hypothetical protein K1719_009531 [Acacia pycnantha]
MVLSGMIGNGVSEVEVKRMMITIKTKNKPRAKRRNLMGKNFKEINPYLVVSWSLYQLLLSCLEKGVPAFWLTTMKNNEVLAEENSVGTKTYHMIDEDEPILEKGNWVTTKIMMKIWLRNFRTRWSKTMILGELIYRVLVFHKLVAFLIFYHALFWSTIRDKIIPHVVSWFTGEAIQGEEFGDLEGDEDEDIVEDDEEEEEDDEDEDDDND